MPRRFPRLSQVTHANVQWRSRSRAPCEYVQVCTTALSIDATCHRRWPTSLYGAPWRLPKLRHDIIDRRGIYPLISCERGRIGDPLSSGRDSANGN